MQTQTEDFSAYKSVVVTFILTGDCGDTTDPGYTSYQQIASASSGEIFSVVEGDVEKVLDAVIETVIPKYDPAAVATGRAPDGSLTSLNGSSLEYREVNMMALTFETGNDAIKTPLRIDSHTSDFTVSVVGEKVNVELFDPAGSSTLDFDVRFAVEDVITDFDSLLPRPVSDVNECDKLIDNCDDNAFCTDTFGSFYCDCKPGFLGNGVVCTNINECKAERDPCKGTGNCTDTEGSFSCTCGDGFMASSETAPLCKDINECASANGNCEQECVNTAGSFYCQCASGYVNTTGVGMGCTDINECSNHTLNECHPDGYCENEVPGYFCGCNPGYTGSGFNCTDINECEGNFTCPLNSLCRNLPGKYDCPDCMKGYRWDLNKTSCYDIDECVEGIDTCPPNSVCNNTVGSFECPRCMDGYDWTDSNQTACADVDECAKGTHTCPENSVCNNTIGSFECPVCKDGFNWTDSNQTACADVNECAIGTHTCPENSVCNNTIGSFECPRCMDGYDWTDSNQTACEGDYNQNTVLINSDFVLLSLLYF
ncbi:hypothetical protein EB796_025268 [Bugula neritina]|uniref:EGF-like domain-containing protein n=1 Tax=Bugula neritina TaxID=10212 RepID=A0A7J7IS81_BUGNE|nr:hypothetical protein EB796_025268 [Bugula neritina]